MFYIQEPAKLGKPWVLSHWKDKNVISISKNVVKCLNNYHIMGIEFLYRNFRQKMNGAILNEEKDMNSPLQVSAFLNAVIKSIERQFIVLVICPDNSLCSWHYHLINHANLKVFQITSNTTNKISDDLKDLDKENGVALLLTFSNIKLAQDLLDLNYFSVIVDDFDKIATKLIVRKLKGKFNIGLSSRSFYTDPNQKLQWTMLDWSNPGCVGKLVDFYDIDNNNLRNFRDSYRFWWFRLTWKFCDSFKKPTVTEIEEYEAVLKQWTKDNNLNEFIEEKKPKKRINKTSNNENTKKLKTLNLENPNEKIVENESSSSDDTIIYEPINVPTNYVKLPSMDENPIVSSIIKNFENSPEPIKYYPSSYNYEPFCYSNQPNCSKAIFQTNLDVDDDDDDEDGDYDDDDDDDDEDDDEDVLLSIIANKSNIKTTGNVTINDDKPCTSKSIQSDDDFFSSLISANNNQETKVEIDKNYEKNAEDGDDDDDVDKILKEADLLLQN